MLDDFIEYLYVTGQLDENLGLKQTDEEEDEEEKSDEEKQPVKKR